MPSIQQITRVFINCSNVACEYHWIFVWVPLNFWDTGEIFCRNVLSENQVCSPCQPHGTVWEWEVFLSKKNSSKLSEMDHQESSSIIFNLRCLNSDSTQNTLQTQLLRHLKPCRTNINLWQQKERHRWIGYTISNQRSLESKNLLMDKASH